jgi:hypothetical protein
LIEIYQLMSDGSIISLGSSAQAEGEAARFMDLYPNAGYHMFFGKRVIEPCDPPLVSTGR